MTDLSLSSAAAEASANFAVAVANLSSERSKSSSNNWIRRLRAATSDSACNETKIGVMYCLCKGFWYSLFNLNVVTLN